MLMTINKIVLFNFTTNNRQSICFKWSADVW